MYRKWTFSRAFAEFAANRLPSIVHEALIKEFQSDRLVGHTLKTAGCVSKGFYALQKEVESEQSVTSGFQMR